MLNTEPIRVEHKGLLPHIERLRQTADAVGVTSDEELAAQVHENVHFLRHHLVPHAMAEDKVLYPAIDELMGAPGATQTMSRDHVAVVELTERLEALHGSNDYNALREVLYGLYALVRVHFDKEEEIYLPLLDERLSEAEAKDLFARMEASGHHGH